jgi:flagellin-like hook-associated protein FlgL
MTTIQGSFAGMNTVRNISLIQRSLTKTMHRVSSDAEALPEDPETPLEISVSQKMRSQIGSLTDRIRKLEFGLGRSEAAGSSIQELIDKARSLREVAVEASDEVTNKGENSKILQTQFSALANNYNESVESANYAGIKLFDGSEDSVTKLTPMKEMDVSTADAAKETVKKIDYGLRELAEARVASESKSRLEYETTIRSFEVASQNMMAAGSLVHDTESATSQARLLRAAVQTNVELAGSAQGQLTSDTVFKLLHA